HNGLNYKPTQVVVSNGAKHACYNAILATCQPGDEVIIPAPYWVSYPDMVKLAGAEAVIIPTSERNGWKIRAEDFENAMTPRTKIDRKSTRLNSSHVSISYAVFCL